MKNLFPILVPALCASLTACGGGSDSGNGQAQLTVTPSTITATSPINSCPANGQSFQVFVLGGSAPYTIRNPLPNRIGLSTETIADDGGAVVVTLTGGCFATIPLSFTDDTGQTVSMTISYSVDPTTS